MVIELGFYSSAGILDLRDVVTPFCGGLLDGVYVSRCEMPSTLFL